jgi:hypothetical protein
VNELHTIFKSPLVHQVLSNFHHGWWFSLGRLILSTGAGKTCSTRTGEATRFRHIITSTGESTCCRITTRTGKSTCFRHVATCTRESTCCRIATCTRESALGTHHLSHVASSALSRRSSAHLHAFAHATHHVTHAATGVTHAAAGVTHATHHVTHTTATRVTHAATRVTHTTATHTTWGSTRRALGRRFFRYGGRCFAFITTTEREQQQG